MASKQSEELNKLYLEWVAALKANPEMPLDELRLMFEQWERITSEPGGVDYIEADAGGVPAMWAVPKNCAQDRVMLCAHGGGYVCGSMYTHRKTYAHAAKAIGCRALNVDRRETLQVGVKRIGERVAAVAAFAEERTGHRLDHVARNDQVLRSVRLECLARRVHVEPG